MKTYGIIEFEHGCSQAHIIVGCEDKRFWIENTFYGQETNVVGIVNSLNRAEAWRCFSQEPKDT